MKSYEFESNGGGSAERRSAPRQGSVAMALFAAFTIAATAQTRVDLRTQSRNVDFSAATSTKPSKTGTTLPTACSVGETFLKTDAAAGKNLYACTQANTWTVQGVPDPTGNADKVLSNDGATTGWRAMGGDVGGRPDALTVVNVQGRAVSSAAPLNGQALVWNSVAAQWQPQNSGAAAITGVFGRTGAVTAQTGDYTFGQIGGSVTDSQVSAGINANKIGSGTVGNAALGYLATVTSDVQTQLNGKAPGVHSHTAAGDVIGDLGSTSVTALRNRAVAATAPANGQVLVWNAAASQWQPQNVSGAVGGASMGAQLGDFNVTQTSAAILTIGPNCSTATPCNVRWGNRVFSFVNAATVTLTAGAGVAYIYVDADGTLTVGHNLTLTCASSCTATPATTAFPVNSIPLYTWTATAGVWDAAGGLDKRSLLSGKILSAGTGIVTMDTGSNTNISVDAAAVALLFSPVFSGQPAIPDFTLAPHAHTNAAGGGTLTAAAIVSGLFPIARLASGTPDGTKFVRDDGTLAVPAGGGSTSYPGVTSDGAGGLTLTGGIATGVGSGVATTVDFNQGTAPPAQAVNTFRLRAPAAVPTAYSWTVPSADAAGSVVSDGAGNLSLNAFSGTGSIVRATGNAATATALAALPTLCTGGLVATGILANGNATGCTAAGGGGVGTATAGQVLYNSAGAVAGLSKVGTGTVVPMAAALGGSGNCANWGAAGIGDAGAPCGVSGGSVASVFGQTGVVGAIGDLGATGAIINNAITTAKIAASAVDLTTKVTGILPSANSQPHQIGFVIDGGGVAIAAGDIGSYQPVDFACTINRVDVTGSPSGSVTVDVWKAAGAIPTSGGKISATAPIALASAQISLAGSLTGWTTAVAVGDVFGFSVASAATVQRVTGNIWCQ
ncbi:MAG TPA: hypothetical protein VKJ01_21900 [Candidatus Solibacter sp.]|nr:hypothetical protein [Candidatus Solibacter sp.]